MSAYLDSRWHRIKALVRRDVIEMQAQAAHALDTGDRELLVDALDQLAMVSKNALENLKLIEGYEDAQIGDKEVDNGN